MKYVLGAFWIISKAVFSNDGKYRSSVLHIQLLKKAEGTVKSIMQEHLMGKNTY